MVNKSIEIVEGSIKPNSNKVKQHFSEHIFAALCAHSNYEFEIIDDAHDYGIDLKIKELISVKNSQLSGKELLRLQVKSTSNWKSDGEFIKYALSNKAYNHMVTHNQMGITPLIVILMCLPNAQEDWVKYGDSDINLRRCLYWYKTDSEELKENPSSTTTIDIPTKQRFKINTLTRLIERYKVTRGGQ